VELRKALDDLIKEVSIRELNLKSLEAKFQSLSTEHNHELEKQRKHGDLLSKIGLCYKGIELLKSVKDEVIGEVRNTIEAKTKEYFLALIWKKDTYVDVRIDSNFRVSVINRLGGESIGSLSAGERQVLALSFMAALTKVSGFKAPVIIDTPLGRISGEPKDNIAAALPEYLRDTQVTMLMTDQEYTPSVREKLFPRVGKEWALQFDEQNFATSVRPYNA
jgi:DNA sulfur modification protein DndD